MTQRSRLSASVCIAPAFRQVVRFGTSRPFFVHMSVSVRTTAPCSTCIFGVCLCCLPVLTWTNLSADGSLFGTTEWNHSYYTGNSLSALYSLQQLQAGASSPSPVQMSASTRESHDAAPSSSVSCPQATLSAAHPQVQMDPTRTITSDLMSATPAEAATQLSFLALLERCIFVNASRRSRYPITTPLLDAATQTKDVSTQLSFRGVIGSTFYARCSLPHVFPTRPSASP